MSNKHKPVSLDLDVDGFAERLGAGIERFARGDWSMLVEPPRRAGVDQETRKAVAEVISEITAMSEYILMMEAATLAAAAAIGLDPNAILACQELGRRRGRRRALAHIEARVGEANDDAPSAG